MVAPSHLVPATFAVAVGRYLASNASQREVSRPLALTCDQKASLVSSKLAGSLQTALLKRRSGSRHCFSWW